MLGPAAITLILLTPAAPVPAGPPAPPSAVDPAKAAEFGNMVYAAATKVSETRRDVELTDLVAGAIRGMYETAGQPPPADLLRAIRNAKRHEDRIQTIADARTRLAAAPALRGVRAYLSAVHGFRHAFDQPAGLAIFRARDSVSVDMDFGLGFELDGVEGQRVTAYRLEYLVASGAEPTTGLLEPPPRPDAVPSPAAYPWRVRRVIPGGPAHRAGLKAGDILTHLNDAKITVADADRLFARLAFQPDAAPDPRTGMDRQSRFTFDVRREGATPVRVSMATEAYTPTNVTGVVLRKDGTWDGMLDPLDRIGYVRVGAVEGLSDKAVASIVSDLAGRACRGLVLDLRWCPGGWINQGVCIADMFLPPNTVVAREAILPQLVGTPAGQSTVVYRSAWGGPRYMEFPLAVLVGDETIGGGELIAAALQDHRRAVIVGQRTFGRAAAQQQTALGFAHLWFKATYGITLRPSGKPRHRTPTSGPTDHWGVRPDAGFEVPVTPAVASEIRTWAEEHALRPAGSRAALAFDDPDRDPVRAAALAHLRKILGPPAPPAQN